MPPRRASRSTAVAASDPTTPSPAKVSARSSRRSTTTGTLTPATSVEEDDVKPTKGSKSMSYTEPTADDTDSSLSDIDLLAPASNKRKRRQDSDASSDEVTFVSHTPAPRRSNARSKRTAKQDDDETETEANLQPIVEIEVKPSRSKGKGRAVASRPAPAAKGKAKKEESPARLAEDFDAYAQDSEEEAEQLKAIVEQALDTAEELRKTAAKGKGRAAGGFVVDDETEEEEEDEESSSDADFAPRSRRRTAKKPKYDSDSDELSDEPMMNSAATARLLDSDDEDADSAYSDDGSVATAATDLGIGSSSAVPAGSALEDTRFETAKQRKLRLKREAREARIEANARRTGRQRRRLRSQYEKNKEALTKHHPELINVWEDLKAQPIVKTSSAEQPAGLNVKLLPFQLEGLAWLKSQEQGSWKGGILADEMGMGKTVQMIALFLSDRGKKKTSSTLVIAPTVAIMQWRNEIAKYTADFKVLVWHGATRPTDVKELQKYDVVLTSYSVLESAFRKQESGFKRKGLLIKEKSALHAIQWHRIILDEAHNIKERATNTAKGAFGLKGNYRWCLSGTPLQNRVGELYSMIRFLGGDPHSFYYCKRCPCKQLHWMFSDRRHCDACGHTPMHHICFWNNEILKPIQKMGPALGEGKHAYDRLRLLLDHMMLRRTKLERADDMGLPPRTIIVRRDLFNEEEEDLYTSLYQDTTRKFNTYLDQGTVLNNYSNIFTLLTRMRQLACHPDLVLRSKTGLTQKLLGDGQNDAIHVCRICTDEAEDAIMSKCKHVFCRLCVTEYLESDIVQAAETPECPYCHATLSIDLEQDMLDPPAQQAAHASARQGILQHLDMDRWRSSTKIEALVEELTRLRSEDKTIKSLVFSQFVNFLDLIAYRLGRAGFKMARLEGGMSPEARDRTIQAFNTDTNTTVFLISLRAGGVGLNLTPASRVFVMDPWWNSALATQAMDRIHRLGQHRPIVVHQMIIADSIESRILELQANKASMIESTLGKDESALGRLTVADLGFLFAM